MQMSYYTPRGNMQMKLLHTMWEYANEVITHRGNMQIKLFHTTWEYANDAAHINHPSQVSPKHPLLFFALSGQRCVLMPM